MRADPPPSARARWLALASAPSIGGATARALLARFGSLEAIFAASASELTQVPRIRPATAEQLLSLPLERLEAGLGRLEAEAIELLTWDDVRFPSQLRALPDAPLVLFLRGSIEPGDARAVAIVGTRAPSAAGAAAARHLAAGLAARGLTIVSGFALGIDAAAHQGALDAERGRTLAVLGSGLGRPHLRQNAELAEQIIRRGGLLSELHPDTRPRGPLLMARDRIVSGLSRAVIVVEAGERSGSLDTATKAERQRRLVYAVPGSPGTEQLLADGARRLDPASYDPLRLAEELAALAPEPRPARASLRGVGRPALSPPI